jgi:hypothetical protein
VRERDRERGATRFKRERAGENTMDGEIKRAFELGIHIHRDRKAEKRVR